MASQGEKVARALVVMYARMHMNDLHTDRMRFDRMRTDRIGQRLRRAREVSRLSGVECARRAAITAHALWRYESGRVVPGAMVLARLALVLGVSMEWLALGRERSKSKGRH